MFSNPKESYLTTSRVIITIINIPKVRLFSKTLHCELKVVIDFINLYAIITADEKLSRDLYFAHFKAKRFLVKYPFKSYPQEFARF